MGLSPSLSLTHTDTRPRPCGNGGHTTRLPSTVSRSAGTHDPGDGRAAVVESDPLAIYTRPCAAFRRRPVDLCPDPRAEHRHRTRLRPHLVNAELTSRRRQFLGL